MPSVQTRSTGVGERVTTPGGVAIGVRAPGNYDGTLAHPLLVAFAPAGYGRSASERFYGLTREATAAGFIVAFPDHLPLSRHTIDELGRVVGAVAASWCVDSSRVYLAGHSDGGTVSAALTFLGTSVPRPRAVAISAAGIRREDLDQYACPDPVGVLIVHSRRDERFPPPAYGRDASRWWAACNRCQPVPGAVDGEGCIEWSGCANAVRTRYCEVDTNHAEWPIRSPVLLAFFLASKPGPGVASAPK
ncbi:MAG TPA: poly(3-hydroxybutyrate) depolymerase [Burkholderiales bacterium]|nr:poly(3-hydroxybutyrate) depolymerase [Burkholderiales bacterium]